MPWCWPAPSWRERDSRGRAPKGSGERRGGGGRGAGAEGERRAEAGGRVAPREEAFKMIDAYIVSNLQESLDLTDEQFVKLLPLVKRLQSDRRAVLQRRQQALMEV